MFSRFLFDVVASRFTDSLRKKCAAWFTSSLTDGPVPKFLPTFSLDSSCTYVRVPDTLQLRGLAVLLAEFSWRTFLDFSTTCAIQTTRLNWIFNQTIVDGNERVKPRSFYNQKYTDRQPRKEYLTWLPKMPAPVFMDGRREMFLLGQPFLPQQIEKASESVHIRDKPYSTSGLNLRYQSTGNFISWLWISGTDVYQSYPKNKLATCLLS